MRFVRPNDADIDAALEIATALEGLATGAGASMPSAIALPQPNDGSEAFDLSNPEHCQRLSRYVIELAGKGSVGRVAMAMAILLDPRSGPLPAETGLADVHSGPSPVRVPEGWTIRRSGNELIIQSPVAGPGGVMLAPADSGGLEKRLLIALAESLIREGATNG